MGGYHTRCTASEVQHARGRMQMWRLGSLLWLACLGGLGAGATGAGAAGAESFSRRSPKDKTVAPDADDYHDHHQRNDLRPTGAQPRALQAEEDRDIGGGAKVIVRHGVLFQTGGCPQAITSEEARERAEDASLPGGVMILASQNGRTSSHFGHLSMYFSMAFCCRSKVLTMPSSGIKGKTADGAAGAWEATKRWYDFSRNSHGEMMDMLPEFKDLSERPEVCRPNWASEEKTAFHPSDVHPDLQRCIEHVFVRGCEAEFVGDLVKTSAFCPTRGDGGRNGDGDNRTRRRGRRGLMPSNDNNNNNNNNNNKSSGIDGNDQASSAGAFEDVRWSTAETRRTSGNTTTADRSGGGGNSGGAGGDGAGSSGSLVIHVHSGDMFNSDGQGAKRPSHGQPPLQFLLLAIASKPWSDVTVLTFAERDEWINPTFSALKMLNRSGVLGPHVTLFQNRPLLEDLRTMLCADGLAVSRSSLHLFTLAHSRAETLFMPHVCDKTGAPYGDETRTQHGRELSVLSNTTLVILENPEAEVYGIEWTPEVEAYSPYDKWEDTTPQLLEMLLFKDVKGLTRCGIDD